MNTKDVQVLVFIEIKTKHRFNVFHSYKKSVFLDIHRIFCISFLLSHLMCHSDTSLSQTLGTLLI